MNDYDENVENGNNGNSHMNWEIIKQLRKEFNPITHRAAAIQVRQGMTPNNNLTFSYVFGVVTDDNDDGVGTWKSYHYIPDRYAIDYLELFQEAVSRIRIAMDKAREEGNGIVTPAFLERKIMNEFRRRRH